MSTPAPPHLGFAGWIEQQQSVPVMHAVRISDVATAWYGMAEALHDLVGMIRR
ncbi:2,4-dienoyl-CoA reductase-like NADH-dependent reductase (Old Yellow Enzyme family) [Streptomyces luteogriseus]|uniref:hypothetical protein n=1 Tax=Streptomyces luteogriseus TaxID=68233 RepID=UPI00278275C5|nr:hypothetical protein [Streptomyces luteogriseus]MDQ0711348.1 2,4-dienoyl-CoA reductase-like NADH-dependent reductase (Old Yellow Enzyme family) [Streptomyces luteogriseus]